jgi:hypothetical protein
MRSQAIRDAAQTQPIDLTKDEDSFDLDPSHQLLSGGSSFSLKTALPPIWVDYYERILDSNRMISK